MCLFPRRNRTTPIYIIACSRHSVRGDGAKKKKKEAEKKASLEKAIYTTKVFDI